jgi:hypothetical protein
VFGIWPAGDFRYDPSELGLTYVLIALVVVAAALGAFLAWRRRSYGLVLFLAAAGVGAAASAAVGSPWIDAKAFAIASPAFVLTSLAGAAMIYERGRRVEALVLIALIGGGVVWSNGLAYREAWLAPYDKLSELEDVGERIAGEGPTLMTEYEPYGVRHFLREADPEGASELRRRLVPQLDGTSLPKAVEADVDQLRLDGLLQYRTLVLRRSPLASRPPSAFRITWRGRFYEIWERRTDAPAIVTHVPLGAGGQPASTPRCAEIMRVAEQAGSSGQVAAVLRSPATVLSLSETGVVFPQDSFEFRGTAELPAAGRYGVWVGGEFRGRVALEVGGRRLGDERHRLKPGQFTLIRELDLPAGPQDVALAYGGPDSRPGSSGRAWFGLGPIALSRSTAERPVTYVSAANARSLCGKSLDWVEAISS